MLLARTPASSIRFLPLVKLPEITLLFYCPVPVSATVWGLPGALSTMVSVPLWPPATVGGGVKVTLIVQKAPAAKGLTQLLVWAWVPLVVMLVIVSGARPLLVSFTGLAALVVPSA